MDRTSTALRRWIPHLLLALVVGLSVAVVIDVVRLGGWQAWLVRHRIPATYAREGRTIDVDGTAVYLDCRGTGSPTVLLEAGFAAGASSWGYVLPWVGERTRVCAWDRPAIGASGPIGIHTVEDTARRLRAILRAAGETPPFVIVGHSLGGVYARVFASTYRAEVGGVVLVDPYLPDIHPVEHVAIPPALRDAYLASLADTNEMVAAGEGLDWSASSAQLSRSSLGSLPVELLFVDQRLRWEGAYDPFEDRLIAVWRRLVRALSSDARLTIATDSTHMIQLDRPDLVVAAIERLIAR